MRVEATLHIIDLENHLSIAGGRSARMTSSPCTSSTSGISLVRATW